MPLKLPTPPSSPPPLRLKPHFGGEGTPTPISSRLPQSSSAGSTINSGGSSRPGDPSPLRGSAAGNTDPIPSPLPPKRPESPELPNDRFKVTERQINAYDGRKRPDLTDYFAEDGSKIQDLRKDSDGNLYFIGEHDHSFRAEFYEDDMTHVMIYDPYGVENTIFLQLFTDGHYRQVESWLLESSPSPQLPLSPHQPVPSPVSPSLSPTIVDISTPPPQSGPSTAPKRLWHPWSPDGAQPSPPKRPKVDGGMSVADMPPELTHGSGNFWRNKDPATRQLAVNLFQNGKIRDVTYGKGGKEISGKFDYTGKEYRFSYFGGMQATASGTKPPTVTFQNIDGNKIPVNGINGRTFSNFLRLIEGEAPALLIGGATAPASPRLPIMTQNMPGNFSIPNELNPPAARDFWTRAGHRTQFLLTELYRNRKIYGINFSTRLGGAPHLMDGDPRLNAIMRYQGRDYAFSVGANQRFAFLPEIAPPHDLRNSESFSEVLEIIANNPLP